MPYAQRKDGAIASLTARPQSQDDEYLETDDLAVVAFYEKIQSPPPPPPAQEGTTIEELIEYVAGLEQRIVLLEKAGD